MKGFSGSLCVKIKSSLLLLILSQYWMTVRRIVFQKRSCLRCSSNSVINGQQFTVCLIVCVVVFFTDYVFPCTFHFISCMTKNNQYQPRLILTFFLKELSRQEINFKLKRYNQIKLQSNGKVFARLKKKPNCQYWMQHTYTPTYILIYRYIHNWRETFSFKTFFADQVFLRCVCALNYVLCAGVASVRYLKGWVPFNGLYPLFYWWSVYVFSFVFADG